MEVSKIPSYEKLSQLSIHVEFFSGLYSRNFTMTLKKALARYKIELRRSQEVILTFFLRVFSEMKMSAKSV